MSILKDGGSAFPVTPKNGSQYRMPGMTLRDFFAAHAIAATNPNRTPRGRAVQAYEIADVMLEHRLDDSEKTEQMREDYYLCDEENQS
jgi:hypothetical protein